MNYIFAGLSLLILLQPVDVLIREKQLRNQSYTNNNKQVKFDDFDIGETVL